MSVNGTVIDAAKCMGCGACGAVCPLGIIAKDEKSDRAIVAKERAAACVQCGHCEAICPTGAITVNGELLQPAAGQAAPVSLTAEQVGGYFRSRRSIRLYHPEPVDKQLLEQLFDVVRYAPTGVNGQPVRWIVVHDTAALKKLTGVVVEWMRAKIAQNDPVAARLPFKALVGAWDNGIDAIFRGAPHLVVATAHKDSRIAAIDNIIALAHLELAAPAFGLGACWAGYFNVAASMSPEIQKALGLPADHVFLNSMMLGRPQSRYLRIPKRNKAVIAWK